MDLETKKKWGLILKAVVIMLLLLIPRTIIDILGYDTVPINPVVGAFISGAIFTIAIIFTGHLHGLQGEREGRGRSCRFLEGPVQ